MDDKEIRKYLNVIKRAVALIESKLDNDDGGLLEVLANPVEETKEIQSRVPVIETQPVTKPPAIVQPANPPRPKKPEVRHERIEKLMSYENWPEAVPSYLAGKKPSEVDQKNRAKAVLDMMLDRPMEGLDFLDFGCGEGWIAHQAVSRGVLRSVGYDIVENELWKSLEGTEAVGPRYTKDFNSISNTKFDIVMLYDVLDHSEDPLQIMKEVRQLVKKDGSVYVRCHPWTSKHASHLYKEGLNKAYIHLFLNWEEIMSVNKKPPLFTRHEKNPLEAYRWWFKDFEIKKERPVKEPPGSFFDQEILKSYMISEQGVEPSEVPVFIDSLNLQFVDYVLAAK